jgi:type IV pilus assembly protein PilQ
LNKLIQKISVATAFGFLCGAIPAFSVSPPSTPTENLMPPVECVTPAPASIQDKNLIQVDASIPEERSISLNFTNIKTQELLQVISQFVGINFVVSDSVKGSMSIHLRKVPWEDALQVILKAQGLAMRRMDNVIYVAPQEDMTKYELQALHGREDIQKAQPLNNMVIKLRYADAEAVYKTITSSSLGSLLSERGKASFDKRSNSIWLSDTQQKLVAVREMIGRLDRPVKQVMIEARIVEIDQNYESEIGVRFGITNPRHFSGTLNGANQMLTGVTPPFISNANNPLLNLISPQGPRLNFDMPSVPQFGRAGTIAIALAKFGQTLVDLELSALEQEGKIHLVSSPRLVTSDLAPAYIQTGEQIPYQQATSSGATAVEFVQATLGLKVTPQLTPNNRVILRLTVTNNQALPAVPLSGGGSAIPISTQEEQSVVLVNDKQTIVLGGVYTQNKQRIVTRVPFFGSLPLVGVLFRHTRRQNNRSELLIFLTPHIIYSPRQLSQE